MNAPDACHCEEGVLPDEAIALLVGIASSQSTLIAMTKNYYKGNADKSFSTAGAIKLKNGAG